MIVVKAISKIIRSMSILKIRAELMEKFCNPDANLSIEQNLVKDFFYFLLDLLVMYGA